MKKIGILLISIWTLSLLSCGGNKQVAEEIGKVDKMTEQHKYKKRNEANPLIAIDTDYGSMVLELYHDVAPTHVDSMLSRVREGFYDGLIFHRVIEGFMIQGGDPTGTGAGDAGYNLKAEFSDLPHVEGTLSMARARDPNSASCQFFICLAPQPHLNGQYTVFGQLLDGFDTLHKIGGVPTGANDRPVRDVIMRSVHIVDEEP
jgi:cyclophilin family peptidyl-prolyl cis-trans isomerase